MARPRRGCVNGSPAGPIKKQSALSKSNPAKSKEKRLDAHKTTLFLEGGFIEERVQQHWHRVQYDTLFSFFESKNANSPIHFPFIGIRDLYQNNNK